MYGYFFHLPGEYAVKQMITFILLQIKKRLSPKRRKPNVLKELLCTFIIHRQLSWYIIKSLPVDILIRIRGLSCRHQQIKFVLSRNFQRLNLGKPQVRQVRAILRSFLAVLLREYHSHMLHQITVFL